MTTRNILGAILASLVLIAIMILFFVVTMGRRKEEEDNGEISHHETELSPAASGLQLRGTIALLTDTKNCLSMEHLISIMYHILLIFYILWK
jgi:hypothetical protein